MSEHRLTVSSLAEKSGLSEPTVRRAVRSNNEARLNTTSATRIASALDTEVDQINWRGGGLSNRGRPAGSGGSSARHPD
ncbi:MAG: helix-turn-helix domain-containing protein [Candidatus Microsaccharimonas sp.]